MIYFVLGVVTTFSILGVGYVGYRLGKKETVKSEVPKLSQTEIKKQEELKELYSGMNKVLNYSEADARKHYRG